MMIKKRLYKNDCFLFAIILYFGHDFEMIASTVGKSQLNVKHIYETTDNDSGLRIRNVDITM